MNLHATNQAVYAPIKTLYREFQNPVFLHNQCLNEIYGRW